MKVINYKDNSVIKRHCGTLPREEGGEAGVLQAEAKRYKRESEGGC